MRLITHHPITFVHHLITDSPTIRLAVIRPMAGIVAAIQLTAGIVAVIRSMVGIMAATEVVIRVTSRFNLDLPSRPISGETDGGKW